MFDDSAESILADDKPIAKPVFDLYKHPINQAATWGVPNLYGWQKAILDACWGSGRQVAVRTCNESGKSSVAIPVLAMSFAAAFPGGQVVITSASERQLEKQLQPGLKSMCSRVPDWRYTNGTIYAPAQDGMPNSMISWFTTKQGERFEGFHEQTRPDEEDRYRSTPLLIIVDEAKSVSADIFTAVERCDATVRLNISTTGEDSGDFYESCMNTDGLWITEWEYGGMNYDFTIDWLQCPHLCVGMKKKKREAMLAKHGDNHPKTCSILLAKFFRGGTHMVFDDYDMRVTREAMQGHITKIPGNRSAFCDFSGGGDELVFGYREGNEVHPFVAWNRDGNIPPSTEAQKYIRLFERFELRPENISGDNGGLGALIISEMELRGWPIRRINPNVKARQQDQFVDRYAEDHWKLKQLLAEECIILPEDDTLMKQMRLRRYIMKNTEDNRVRIEPKQDAKKNRREDSPDRLDTLVGLVRDMPQISVTKGAISTGLRCGSPNEFRERMKQLREQENDEQDPMGWDWS